MLYTVYKHITGECTPRTWYSSKSDRKLIKWKKKVKMGSNDINDQVCRHTQIFWIISYGLGIFVKFEGFFLLLLWYVGLCMQTTYDRLLTPRDLHSGRYNWASVDSVSINMSTVHTCIYMSRYITITCQVTVHAITDL
jgi:hypothetical protein